MALFTGVPDCPKREPGMPSQRLASMAGACGAFSGKLHQLQVSLANRKRLSTAELTELRAVVGYLADAMTALKASVDLEDGVLLNVRGEW